MYICLGRQGRQVFLAAEGVLAVVDGVSQFLQHHVQRGVLGQFHHEHAGLHADVARVWLTWRGEERTPGDASQLNHLELLLHNELCNVRLPRLQPLVQYNEENEEVPLTCVPPSLSIEGDCAGCKKKSFCLTVNNMKMSFSLDL